MVIYKVTFSKNLLQVGTGKISSKHECFTGCEPNTLKSIVASNPPITIIVSISIIRVGWVMGTCITRKIPVDFIGYLPYDARFIVYNFCNSSDASCDFMRYTRNKSKWTTSQRGIVSIIWSIRWVIWIPSLSIRAVSWNLWCGLWASDKLAYISSWNGSWWSRTLFINAVWIYWRSFTFPNYKCLAKIKWVGLMC